MQIIFVHTYTCPCGGTRHGCVVSTVRINKNSIVQTRGLGVMPPNCRDCQRSFQPDDPVRITIDPNDMAKVNAYRVRRGWTPIADAAVGAAMAVGSGQAGQEQGRG